MPYNRSQAMAARRADHERARVLLFGAVGLAAIALLMWPLQTLLVAILGGTMVVLMEGLDAWLRARNSAIDRELFGRRAAIASAGVVALGVVVVAMWPMAMAVATLLLAFVACAVNALARWAASQAGTPPTTPPPRTPAAQDSPALVRRPSARRRPANPTRRRRTRAPSSLSSSARGT